MIRGAFCIVPVQASGIFGQVPLACACHSLVRLPCCSRLCAHPPAAAHPPLSALELSLSRLLTRPLATLYLPLSHLHLSPQSPSLNARSRLNMPCFNITSASSGRKHRGHSLPDLFSPWPPKTHHGLAHWPHFSSTTARAFSSSKRWAPNPIQTKRRTCCRRGGCSFEIPGCPCLPAPSRS